MTRTMMTLLLTFAVASPVYAATVEGQNDKLSELELATDFEELEAFGEQEREETVKAETSAAEREAKRLQREIDQMQAQNKRSSKKVTKLNKKFYAKNRIVKKLTKRHSKVAAEKNKLDAKLSRIQGIVDGLEQDAIRLVAERKSAERAIAKMKRLQKRLKKREATAKRIIRTNKNRLNKTNQRAKRLARNTSSEEKRVMALEKEAIRWARK